jgi:ribosomal protein L7/L12
MNTETLMYVGFGAFSAAFLLTFVVRVITTERENLLKRPSRPIGKVSISKEDAEEIAILLKSNKRLEAIKLLRNSSGRDLKSSKEIIDRVAAGNSLLEMVSFREESESEESADSADGADHTDSSDSSDSSKELDRAAGSQSSNKSISAERRKEIARLVEKGQKLQAIKVYRKATGVSLKDAKDAIEAGEF